MLKGRGKGLFWVGKKRTEGPKREGKPTLKETKAKEMGGGGRGKTLRMGASNK